MSKLYVVGTPIGNLSDISKRAIETLKNVDNILCEDTRHSLKLLNHYEIKNKLISYHKFNEKEKTNSIIKKIKENDISIALITDAGMPCISDPGYILIQACHENNIEVIGVGGISALTTAISVSGLNSDSFSFYGFFPRETKEKKELIAKLKASKINVVIFYESPKRIIKTLEYLLTNLGDNKISLSSDLTKLYEKTTYGKISDIIKILEESSKATLGEYTLVLELDNNEELTKEDISIEAKLFDTILKNNVTLKEAIEALNKKEPNLPKNAIKEAALNLKNKIRM